MKVRSEDIDTGAVNARIIADGAIQRRHLSAGLIGAGQLGSGVVSGDTIATHGIITNNLSDGIVTAPKVGDDAIVARHIMNGTLEVAKFAESLRPVQLVDDLPPLPDDEYPPGAVVFHKGDGKMYRNVNGAWSAEVATVDLTGVIEELQIADAAISAAKLSDNAVVARTVAAGAVVSDKIAANAITAGKIAALAVEADKIAANAVTAGKIAADAVTAGTIQAGAVSTDELAANAISADKIKANAVGATQLAALYLEVGKYIRSSNYVAGSAGWAIDADGNFEANDGTFRGDVLAATITGSVFRTAFSGQRLQISGTDAISYYDGSNRLRGKIFWDSGNLHIDAAQSTASALLLKGDYIRLGTMTNSVLIEGSLLQFDVGASIRSGSSASGSEIQSRDGSSTVGYTGFAGGFFRTASSEQYKRDIEDAPAGAVDTLQSLRVRRFTDRSEQERRRFGLVAEELPAGLQVDDGYDLTEMVALCIQSIQELARGR